MNESPSSDDIVDIGEAHHKSGRLREAEECYRKALAIDSEHPGALYYLASIAYDDGRLQFAAQLITDILRENTRDAEAWHLFGMIAFKEDDYPRAVERISKALELQPSYVQALCNMGNTFSRRGELDPAIEYYRKALAINPHFGEAFFGLANILQLQNQPDKAVSNYRQAINSGYDAPQVYVGLANSLMAINSYAEAKDSLERAISLDPNYADAYRNLGNLQIGVGNLTEGIATLQKSVGLKPHDSALRSNLALALYGTGRLAEALDCLNEAIAVIPDNAEAHSILLGFKQYLPGYSRAEIFSDHLAFGERFASPLRETWVGHLNPINAKKRLRIGFVSGDLYGHPVGYFLEGVLHELYCRNEIDINVYTTSAVTDALTDRLRASSHVWRPVTGLSDSAFDLCIRDDNIDILVDLSGHTIPNRLMVFARKPAPIQVTWLGYWETTGLHAMDYILCDRYGVHDGEEKYFVEKPWCLPHTRLCFSIPSETIAVAPLPALKNNFVTFGCFNNLVKMTDRVVSVWARILKRVPSSRLFLKSISFADPSIRESVMARFAAEGIPVDRLVLEVSSPRQEYFSAYNRVDIALDPFPFPGGTTSVEGIWMGVPMITLRGDRIISRQGESILHNLGLQDWIAADEDDYVELAVGKSEDLLSLAQLRHKLRDKLETSELCNAQLFAQHLEDAFKQMWNQFCQSL